MYHPVETETNNYRVVGFTVEPFSIAHDYNISAMGEDPPIEDDHVLRSVAKFNDPIESCRSKAKVHTSYEMVAAEGRQVQLASGKVLFSYDVQWTENLVLTWGSRWDVYLNMNGLIPAEVHWHSIANSLVIVVVLSAMIVAILVRNLRQDINPYNKVEESPAEELEVFGWKLVHADVFRPPSFSPMLLCICCGTGAQLLATTFFTIIIAALGFLSSARRGHLLMAILLLFVTMGGINGYVTARLYKTFKGKKWQRAILLTSLAFPGIAFALFFLMDVISWEQESIAAMPFVPSLMLLVLWLGISIPLVFAGAYMGFKQEAMEFPGSVSSIPRQIPNQPWYMFRAYTLLIGGLVSFGSFFVELYYIMGSVWMQHYYYDFGFLLLVFFILLITCAEITVLFTYYQLCSQDYHWWWRSFVNAGATALYVFAYSIVYFQQLEADSPVTYILYFGYMALASLALFLLTGAVGVASSLWFNKVLFASKIN